MYKLPFSLRNMTRSVRISTSSSTILSIHDLHNRWKTALGNFLGVNTYTIGDNYKLIKEIKVWKENKTSNIEEKEIIAFIEKNNVHKITTVFFENHWKYVLFLVNLPIIYLYYIAHKNGGTFRPGAEFIFPWSNIVNISF